MVDMPAVSVEEPRTVRDREVGSAPIDSGEISASPITVRESSEIIPLLEETLTVSKLRRQTGSVRISTHVEVVEETVVVELDRYRVDVTRVPIGRVVAEAPLARAEGDTTIVPVIEERFVVVKQLFLKEELHIRHVVVREVKRESITLRRQRATVERHDGAAK